MQAVLALVFLAPAVAAVAGVLYYAVYCLTERLRAWWDARQAGPYIPSRVWWDDRYGGTDGDPNRHWSGQEFGSVPPPFDPGPPAHLPIHAGYRR